MTSQQNVYLSEISEADKSRVAALLRRHGIGEPETLPPVLRHAMSCPALPTCGLAITESERIMPEVVAEIQAELNAVGLDEQIVHLRTSGCPNGCARPCTAEIGIVGASIDVYTIYLGRLATRNPASCLAVSVIAWAFRRFKTWPSCPPPRCVAPFSPGAVTPQRSCG